MTLHIHKYSHNYALYQPPHVMQSTIMGYVRNNLVQMMKYRRWNNEIVTKVTNVYAFRRVDPLEIRMQISTLPGFIDWMRSNGYQDIQIVEKPLYEPAKVEFTINTTKRPFDYQIPIIEYLKSPGYRKVLPLQAGQGKTLCALFAVKDMGVRTALILKPMYIKRWMDDLASEKGIFNLTPNELAVVQGSAALGGLLRQAVDGDIPYKFIIISNRTFANYIRDYKDHVNMEKYANVEPSRFFEVLKIGNRLVDEGHQDFYSVFTMDCFTNCHKCLELSATLEPDDPFMKRMYELLYPREIRYDDGRYVKYVNVVAVPFNLDQSVKKRINFQQRGMTSYSHNALEDSILRSAERLKNFLQMVVALTEKFFISQRYKDYRLLIFASRVDMCQTIADHLSTLYPDLKISKYTQEEDYEITKTMDIIVSTPMSAGTAVDIEKLQTTICTVAIGSTQLNLQMIGRLRELRDSDIKPTFVYTYCVDIEQQVNYHVKKRDVIFKNKVISYLDLTPPKFRI